MLTTGMFYTHPKFIDVNFFIREVTKIDNTLNLRVYWRNKNTGEMIAADEFRLSMDKAKEFVLMQEE